jgi:hypothetical protein
VRATAAVAAFVLVMLSGAAAAPPAIPPLMRPPVLVTRGGVADATVSNNEVKLVRARGLLVAAYAGGASSQPQVMLAASRDGGAHWAPLAQVSDGPVASRLAALAADRSGVVHVVWTRYDGGLGKVYYRAWAPGAAAAPGRWLAPQRRISPPDLYAGFPAVALDGAGRPQVVWYGIREGPTPPPTKHGSIYEILYTGYDGRTWSHPTLVSVGPPDSVNPALAADAAGRLHAVWYQYNGRAYQIRYAEYQGGWQEPEGVSRTSADEFNPDVAVDAQGRLALAWEQHDAQGGGSVIDYTTRTAGAWTEPIVLSGAPAAYHPSVGADATGTVWVAWDADDGQIYARRYKAGWGPILRLTADGGNSFPSVLADAGRLDVLWTHTDPARSSVYFARVTGGP